LAYQSSMTGKPPELSRVLSCDLLNARLASPARTKVLRGV
jgi:hypothetical protein